ncbi:MAG: hypothetical protein U0795_24085 [Pirellulales bacterium]
MKRGVWAVLAILAGFFSPAIVRSSELHIVTAERRLLVDSSATQIIEETSTDVSGKYQKTLMFEEAVRQGGKLIGNVSGSAMMDSTVSDQQIYARGHGTAFASGDPNVLTAVGLSQLMMEFDVDTVTPFLFEGRISLTPRGTDMLNSVGRLRLTGPAGVVYEAILGGNAKEPDTGEIRFMSDQGITGVFAPGRYRVEGYAEGHGEGNKTRCVDFELRLTLGRSIPVPEPALGLLGAAVLAGVCGTRRRAALSR